LHAALLLWFEAGCRKSRTVPFNRARAAEFRLSPDTMSRALRQLETAGLVSIQRPPGRCLRVTILDAPAVPNAADR
jgi:DNA-binding transcriptional regulator YhcF (GntR family)